MSIYEKEKLLKEPDTDGYIRYKNDKGELHRIGAPAVIAPNGNQEYFSNGKRSRLDGPAISISDYHEYWINGSFILDDEFKRMSIYEKEKRLKEPNYQNGPIEYRDEKRHYHRLDGPAYIDYSGYQEYWVDGKRHRLDGPAIIYGNNNYDYYIDGKYISSKERFQNEKEAFELVQKDKDFKIITPCDAQSQNTLSVYEKECLLKKPDADRIIRHRNDKGDLHREDGPAVVTAENNQMYFVNGQQHRLDGPAVISNTAQEYWAYDKRHRLDGPAYLNTYGAQEYWINGTLYSKEQFNQIGLKKFHFYEKEKLLKKPDIDNSICYRNSVGKLHREDGPAIICTDGSMSWYQNDSLHREDGPAKISSGRMSWWRHGRLHRLDGPAVIYSNDKAEFWIDGKILSKEQFEKITEKKEVGASIEINGQLKCWVDGKHQERLVRPVHHETKLKKEKENKMEKSIFASVWDEAKVDIVDAALEGAADAMLGTFKDKILELIGKVLPNQKDIASTIMEFPGVSEILSIGLGLALGLIPKIRENEQVKRARKLLIKKGAREAVRKIMGLLTYVFGSVAETAIEMLKPTISQTKEVIVDTAKKVKHRTTGRKRRIKIEPEKLPPKKNVLEIPEEEEEFVSTLKQTLGVS